jgi:hypothetical protein
MQSSSPKLRNPCILAWLQSQTVTFIAIAVRRQVKSTRKKKLEKGTDIE